MGSAHGALAASMQEIQDAQAAQARAAAQAAAQAQAAQQGPGEGPCHCCDSRRELGDLECPFTWAVPPMGPEEAAYAEDKMFMWAEPYVAAADKIALAYSRHCEGRHWEARAHLVECYMFLMAADVPSSAWPRRCEVYDVYRDGFRHVVDACWAGMCLPERSEYHTGRHVRRADSPDTSVQDFIKTIKPFNRLHRRQQAAALTLKSRFMTDEGLEKLLRHCLRLDPKEGAWKHLLGWSLQDQRGKLSTMMQTDDGKVMTMLKGADGKVKVVEGWAKTEPSYEEVALLRDAYRQRPNPDTMTRLAKTLLESKKFFEEGKRLLDDALTLHPKCPAVLYQALNIYPSIQVPWALEEEMYLRTLELTKDHAHIYVKLGMRYMSMGKQALANPLFAQGLTKNRLAAQAFLEVMKGTVSASKDTCAEYSAQQK